MYLYVVLDLLLEFFGALCARNENYGCLDNLAADFIGSCGYAALENIRKFHDNTLDLERSDTVAGGLDHIVYAADIPVISVFITPSGIACMIETVVPYFFGLFFVFEVALEQTVGNIALGIDYDFTCFTGFA